MDEMELVDEVYTHPKLKTLANCTPKEFLVQTNKIRKRAKNWMDLTQVMEIRKRMPVLTGKETPEEKAEAMQTQARQNIEDMLDAALETNVDETVELLGLMCFVEPGDVDKFPISSYIGAFAEIIGCQEVISFFISLMQLGQSAGFTSAKA